MSQHIFFILYKYESSLSNISVQIGHYYRSNTVRTFSAGEERCLGGAAVFLDVL